MMLRSTSHELSCRRSLGYLETSSHYSEYSSDTGLSVLGEFRGCLSRGGGGRGCGAFLGVEGGGVPADFYYDVEEHVSRALVSEESGLPGDLLTLQ